MQCLQNDEQILIDGATGTEIERLGVLIVGCCCGIGLEHSQLLEEIVP